MHRYIELSDNRGAKIALIPSHEKYRTGEPPSALKSTALHMNVVLCGSSKYNFATHNSSFPLPYIYSTRMRDLRLAPPPHLIVCKLCPQRVSMSQSAAKPELSIPAYLG